MAIKKILCCDRCGNEVKLNLFPKINMRIEYQIRFSHSDYGFLNHEVILCADCTNKFNEFIKKEK